MIINLLDSQQPNRLADLSGCFLSHAQAMKANRLALDELLYQTSKCHVVGQFQPSKHF